MADFTARALRMAVAAAAVLILTDGHASAQTGVPGPTPGPATGAAAGAAIGAAVGATTGAAAWPGATAEAVKKRGQLNCGITTGMPGFASQDGAGRWQGLDIAYCRAIAAAVLGDAEKVRFVPTVPPARFAILQSGDADVLISNSSLTFTRSVQLGLDEVAVNFYAGQGFLVSRSLGVSKIAELNGATICTLDGGSLGANIAAFAHASGARVGILAFTTADQAVAAMEAGHCDGYADDTGSLAGMRSTLAHPADWVVLDGVISKAPLGLHARSGDPQWQKILFWIDAALKTAEEAGVTGKNADEMKKFSTDPTVRALLGAEGEFGRKMGLDDEWALRAVKAGGNYGEIYDAFFGPKALALPRGQNNLWNNGGLHDPLPFR